MHVSVVTPDASFFDGKADMVVLPAADGEMGVLPGHAPLIARLGHGVARVDTGEKKQRVAIYGGFVKVQDDVVTVLAGGAAKPTGDVEAARKAYEAAKADLQRSKESRAAGPDLAEAERAVARARAFYDLMQQS